MRGIADGCERSSGLSGYIAGTGSDATTTLATALAITTRVVCVNEGRHLALGVLQHGAIVVLQRGARGIQRPVRIDQGLIGHGVHAIRGWEHGVDVFSCLLYLGGVTHDGRKSVFEVKRSAEVSGLSIRQRQECKKKLINSIIVGGCDIGMRLICRTITVGWRLGCGCRGESRWYWYPSQFNSYSPVILENISRSNQLESLCWIVMVLRVAGRQDDVLY